MSVKYRGKRSASGVILNTKEQMAREPVPFVYRMRMEEEKLKPPPAPHEPQKITLGTYLQNAPDSERRLIARLRQSLSE